MSSSSKIRKKNLIKKSTNEDTILSKDENLSKLDNKTVPHTIKTKVRRKLTSQKDPKPQYRIVTDDEPDFDSEEPLSYLARTHSSLSSSRKVKGSSRKMSNVDFDDSLSEVSSPPRVPEEGNQHMEQALALAYGIDGRGLSHVRNKNNIYRILKDKLERLQIKWGTKEEQGLPKPGVANPFNNVTMLWGNFNINWSDPSMEKLKAEYTKCLNEINELYLEFDTQGVSKLNNLYHEGTLSLLKICQICENAYNSALSIMKVEVLQRPLDSITFSEKKFLKPFLNLDSLNNKQKLFVRLCNELALQEFRRNGDKCYQEIITDEGYKTQAFKEVCSIKHFIISKCDRIVDAENWKILTSSKTDPMIADLEKSLMLTDDVDFPKIVLNRHKFSFNNGVFVLKNKRFNEHGKPEYYCKFYDYESKDFYEIDKKKTSAKYYDLHFEDYDCEDWYDIPTPNLQSILEYQYSEQKEYNEICRTIYALIGRMLFDRGDLDNWQVMPYIQGMAGSGKSTISGFVLKEFYHGEQIAELDNKMERQFGLGPLCDPDGPKKFITIGDELDKNCQLDLTHLLKMVSGDEIAAARKHKDPIYLRWPHHMWFSGNEIPSWQNKQGALTRRIINIVFEKKVKAKDRDPNLGDRIKHEIPAIMLKCVKAYLELSNKYSTKDFWSFCPRYFKETQAQLANLTNVLRNFLESEEIIYDDSYHVSEHDFYERLVTYSHNQNQQVNLRNKNMVYAGMIQELNEERGTNIRYIKAPQVMYRGKLYRNCWFFHGIRFEDGSVGERKPDVLPLEDSDQADETQVGESEVLMLEEPATPPPRTSVASRPTSTSSRINSVSRPTTATKKIKIKKKSKVLESNPLTSIEVEGDVIVGEEVTSKEREQSFRNCSVVIDGKRAISNKSNPFNL